MRVDGFMHDERVLAMNVFDDNNPADLVEKKVIHSDSVSATLGREMEDPNIKTRNGDYLVKNNNLLKRQNRDKI